MICLPSEGRHHLKPPVTAKDLCEGGVPNCFQVPLWPLSGGCAAGEQAESVETLSKHDEEQWVKHYLTCQTRSLQHQCPLWHHQIFFAP